MSTATTHGGPAEGGERIRYGLILAHGRGDDCFPFGGASARRAKYALEVADVPMVRRVAESMIGAGVEDLTVTVGFEAGSVRAAMADLPAGGGVRFVEVSPFDRGDAHGLAGWFRGLPDGEHALVVNGDLVAEPADHAALVEAFLRRGGRDALTLIDPLVDLPADPDAPAAPSGRAAVVLGSGGAILSAGAAGRPATHRLSGAHALPGSLAPRLARALAEPDARERLDLGQALVRLAAGGAPVHGAEALHPVVHVDHCFDYLEANLLQVERALRRIRESRGDYVHVGGEGEPDPEWIHPGVVIAPGARVVLEEGAVISPHATREAHLASVQRGGRDGASIRIQGDVFLGSGARIGFGADVGGGLYMHPGAVVEDSVVLKRVVLGPRTRVRRRGIVRKDSLLMADCLVEAGADFEGVAGPGSSFMHPLTCFVCTGRECEVAAGNFFGFLRFDQAPASFEVRGRHITPKEPLGNATYLGDRVMTAVLVASTPGTRIGADSVVGPSVIASGRMEGGHAYLPKRDLVKARLDLLRGR
ncbi:MAG: NDP-sugar synthase [Acidobacteriota bacterium]|jgi:NDP-sugar pyrophosphorylase family protein